MGFLDEYTPLKWNEALGKLKYVRNHGIEQFVHMLSQVKDIQGDLLRWGDELEYAILKLDGKPDDPNRKVKISLRAPELMKALKEHDDHGRRQGLSEGDMCSWMPEYGRWMIEATPRKPFEGCNSLLSLEDHMRLRRSRILSFLEPGEIVPTMACFPMLGVGEPTDFIHHPAGTPMKVGGPIANSMFIPDDIINPHVRFGTLTQNIRERRGANVMIKRLKFRDSKTPKTNYVKKDMRYIPKNPADADTLDHAYADAMAFGMGCCCLQVTFQARDISESRHLYDHLAVFTPILMALTAATPFLRGWLMEEDVRWSIVSQSVDDRTQVERGEKVVETHDKDSRLAGGGVQYLRKSRYGGIDCYLCNCKSGADPQARATWHNDQRMSYDSRHMNRLSESGIDEVLAGHIAHLFARDPLVIFQERINIDDRTATDHWENLQSTNWQSVRWKPPPPARGIKEVTSEEHIGWRVEFRTMEIQMTDFENAAFTVLIVLLSRVLLALKLNCYIPISKLEENMRIAHKKDAVLKEKFYFRKSIFPKEIVESTSQTSTYSDSHTPKERKSSTIARDHCPLLNEENDDQYAMFTIREILLGSDSGNGKKKEKQCFPGLIYLINLYFDFVGVDCVTRNKVQKYLDFIVKRATGELQTNAAWMRDFIRKHPAYQKDSRVTQEIAYDLCVAVKEIGEGIRECKEVLGDVIIPKCSPGANPLRHGEVHHDSEPSISSDDNTSHLRNYMAIANQTLLNSQAKEFEEKKLERQRIQDEMKELEILMEEQKKKYLINLDDNFQAWEAGAPPLFTRTKSNASHTSVSKSKRGSNTSNI